MLYHIIVKIFDFQHQYSTIFTFAYWSYFGKRTYFQFTGLGFKNSSESLILNLVSEAVISCHISPQPFCTASPAHNTMASNLSPPERCIKIHRYTIIIITRCPPISFILHSKFALNSYDLEWLSYPLLLLNPVMNWWMFLNLTLDPSSHSRPQIFNFRHWRFPNCFHHWCTFP